MRFVGVVSCVVAVACLGGDGPAIAAPAPTPASESQLVEAKQHYAAASKFYDLAEYEGALREFKEAYRAVEDPAFLFNIAQCHRKLGHAQDAITFYRNYLRRAPNAANKAEVEKRIAELERAPAATEPAPRETTPAADERVAPLVLDLPAPATGKQPPADQTLVAAPSRGAPAAAEETPFYKRAWFWILAGAVVAGAATTLIVLGTRSEQGPFCPDCAGTVVIDP
jgi:tetratricopeptide (TPR) repeat protein